MIKFEITTNEYIDYLNCLKNNIFKVLPLYEEGNPHILVYINDTSDKLKMLKTIIEEVPNGFWYIETLTSLEDISVNIESLEQKDVKRKVFYILNLISDEIRKQCDML